MIIGQKIYLRPIVKNDLEALNKWRNDEDIYKYLGGGFHPVSISQQERWLDDLMAITDKNKRYMICLKDDDKEIGMIGLYDINWIHRVAEIGLYIGETNEHGKGYAKESYKLLESYASNYLNLRKIKLNVVEINKSAKKMWENLEFNVVGNLSKERFIDGDFFNLLIMEKFI